MSLDRYITDVPDDDPDGDARLERELAEACPDCGADGHMPCDATCGCVSCRRAEARLGGDEPPKEAA